MKKSKNNNIRRKTLLLIFGIVFGIIMFLFLGFYLYIALGSNKISNAYSYDDFRKEMENVTEVKYEEFPKNLINAVISAEQPNYFKENSFDNFINPKKMFSYIFGNNDYSRRTISMSVLEYGNYVEARPKVSLFYLKEAYLSSHTIEKDFSKEEILTYYLNKTYLGSKDGEQLYGIKDTAKNYFNKEVKDLSLAECAFIAGAIKFPYKYSPYVDYSKAESVKNEVLDKMYSYGYITEKEKSEAKIIQLKETLASSKIIDTIKEIFTNYTVQFLVDNTPFTYSCYGDYISEKELGLDYQWNGYRKCDFNTYNELVNNFKQYVTDNFFEELKNRNPYLLYSKATSDGTVYYNYFEKDGKMYGVLSGKGSNMQKEKMLEEKIEYSATKVTSDRIEANIVAKWLDAGNYEYTETINMVLIKENETWKIDDYKVLKAGK